MESPSPIENRVEGSHAGLIEIEIAGHSFYTGWRIIKVTGSWPYCRPHKLCTTLIYTSNERGHPVFFKTVFIFILPHETKKL